LFPKGEKWRKGVVSQRREVPHESYLPKDGNSALGFFLENEDPAVFSSNRLKDANKTSMTTVVFTDWEGFPL
jgi:hypothetical protein